MNSMFVDASVIIVVGMASVLMFLLALTGCAAILTCLAGTVEPAPLKDGNKASAISARSANGQPTAIQMAAISSAVSRYRKPR